VPTLIFTNFMAEKEVELIIFGMEGDGDLRLEYPELADVDEFKSLKAKEVRLCWLLGNRTSPIYSLSKRERVVKALELTYGKDYAIRKDLGGIINGDLPDEIVAGIKKMESFNPEYRLRAKLMSQYMFEVLNEMIVLDSVTLAGMDIDEKKKYTDLVVKVYGELPQMVKTLESSYGAKVVERKTRKQVLVKINDVLK
jgi:hypothetical protein